MSLTDATSSEEIIRILESNKINFKIQDTAKDFDASFANNEAKQSILIMLDPKDFELATSVLEQNTVFDINEIDTQHPMFSFSTDELKDVVKNYDEWHPIDVKLAKYLLDKHNITVEQREIKEQQDTKLLKSYDKERSSFLTLLLGYTFCLLGGIAGIGIAIFLMKAKKKLPDGTSQYIYGDSDRSHGFFMLLLGGIVFILLLFNTI